MDGRPDLGCLGGVIRLSLVKMDFTVFKGIIRLKSVVLLLPCGVGDLLCGAVPDSGRVVSGFSHTCGDCVRKGEA